MKLSIPVPPSNWLPIPAEFPTREGQLPREWENSVVADMRENWDRPMDAETEEVVRGILRGALSRVSALDAATLQFWPGPSYVNALVRIRAGRNLDEPLRPVPDLPSGDAQFASMPAVSAIDSPLGHGSEARYTVGTPTKPDVVLGGVRYLFQSAHHFVLVEAEPTLPALIAIMLEPLRALVAGLWINDDDDEEWRPAQVESVLSDEDKWPVLETRTAR